NSTKVRPGTITDYNCTFAVANTQYLVDTVTQIQRAGTGRYNVVADPGFVDAENGDYRILKNSIAATLAPGNKPVGALPVFAGKYKDSSAPLLTLKLKAPAKPSGAYGKLEFERDPWIGGGKSFIKDLFDPSPDCDYVTKERNIILEVDGRDNYSSCTKMKIKVSGAEAQEKDYFPQERIELPEKDGFYDIAVSVKDKAGNWSEEKKLKIQLVREDVKLTARPVIYSNSKGVIAAFETSVPAVTEMLYSMDKTFDESKKEFQPIERMWNSNDGGDWVKRWEKPRLKHHIPLLVPEVKSGKKYYYKIKMTSAAGETSESKVYAFKVAGRTKTNYVSLDGKDAENQGSKKQPFRSLQFAVDRSLPGDAVVMLPGLYVEATVIRHGGVEGAPITVKAEEKGSVIIDGIRRVNSIIAIEASSYIVLSGLSIRGFSREGAGLYTADSPHITVEHCKVRNGLFEDSWPVSYGMFIHRSPYFSLSNSLILRNEWGVALLQSPNSTVVNNTGHRNLYYAVGFIFSAKGSKVFNNSFCFNGNDQMVIYGHDTKALQTFESNYNNFATHLREMARPENFADEKIEKRHNDEVTGSKAIISCYIPGVKDNRFESFKGWQKAYGKDKNSIYVNPKYAGYDPYDFRLLEGSPNIGAGKDGKNIGAFAPVAQ
ncbi:MAG: right-handed parallel beta-helix repeat-containing protein, partial [Planctomycetota bacterium]